MSAAHDIIYGIHATRLVLEHAPDSVLEIWIQDNKRSSGSITQLTDMTGTIPVQYVSKNTLDKLAQYGRHQGIVMRKRRSQAVIHDLDDLVRASENTLPLFLVLDGIQDPHNLGACIRTADAAGVQAVILPRNRAAGISPVVSKVACGAVENVPLVQVTNLARALQELQAAGIWIIGATESAENSIYEIDLDRPLALVMGAEGKGLGQNIRRHCDILVNIPMAGIVESLNVSVATGICLFEAVRQRLKSP